MIPVAGPGGGHQAQWVSYAIHSSNNKSRKKKVTKEAGCFWKSLNSQLYLIKIEIFFHSYRIAIAVGLPPNKLKFQVDNTKWVKKNFLSDSKLIAWNWKQLLSTKITKILCNFIHVPKQRNYCLFISRYLRDGCLPKKLNLMKLMVYTCCFVCLWYWIRGSTHVDSYH